MQPLNPRLFVGVSLLVLLSGVQAMLPVGGDSRLPGVRTAGYLFAALAVAVWTYRQGACPEPPPDAGAGEPAALAAYGDEEVARSDESERAARQQRDEISKACGLLDRASQLIRQNADQTLQARQLADQARETANRGVRELTAIGDAIEALNQSSDKVAQILKIIDRVALETNILALNAAIEATRAGAAGAGFSVVADEVRRLAQSTADAARDTASQIDETVSWIAQVEMLKTEVVNTLDDIAEKSGALAGLVSIVSDASSREAQTIDQVSSAITSLNGSPGRTIGPQPIRRGVVHHARLE